MTPRRKGDRRPGQFANQWWSVFSSSTAEFQGQDLKKQNVPLLPPLSPLSSPLFTFDPASSQIHRDFAELFEGGFQVFDNFLGEDIGIWEVVGFFEAFVSEPEDVEARLVAVDEFLFHYQMIKQKPPAFFPACLKLPRKTPLNQ